MLQGHCVSQPEAMGYRGRQLGNNGSWQYQLAFNNQGKNGLYILRSKQTESINMESKWKACRQGLAFNGVSLSRERLKIT